MEESILKSTKKVLGIGLDDVSFDPDVTQHINSAFSNLTQLGVGPVEGFTIEDDTAVWADLGIDFLAILNEVKTVVYLRTRLLFDPPATSYHLAALQDQIQEHEWRISAMREATGWVDPDPPDPDLAVA
jgi:hypothetical protein